MLDDETLRDGLQSPSVRTPTIDEKIDILQRWMRSASRPPNIGLPGAGPHVAARRRALARAIGELPHESGQLRGAHRDRPTSGRSPRSSQRTGVPIECCAFIGSSPIRQYTEGWTIDFLQQTTEEAIGFAVSKG